MRALQSLLVMLVVAFMTSTVISQNTTDNIETTEGVACSDQLNECQQNLNPIYHQPNELVRAWQNCRTSVLEDKLRLMQLESQVNYYKNKFENLKAEAEDILQEKKQKIPGVEGLWLPIKENGNIPTGAFVNSNDDTLLAHGDFIGRGKQDEKDDVVLCRAGDRNTCWTVSLPHLKKFEVLINNNYKWKWTNFLLRIPENAVIGGYRETVSGWELLYIGRAVNFEFINHGYKENKLLIGQVEGKSRKLLQRAWGVIQNNTYYQILVSA